MALDEKFVLAIILFLVLSMGSSSLIEEEQYIWHFLTSSFYLILLRKSLQSVSAGITHSPVSLIERQNKRRFVQIFPLIVILISGRILRGWHQGGVNWTHLPDISKWLEKGGTAYIKSSQLISVLLTITLSFYGLSFVWSKRRFVMFVGLIILFPGWLVLQHIIKYQNSEFPASSYGATLLVQLIYATLGTSAVGIVIALPWIMPIQNAETCSSHHSCSSKDVPSYSQSKVILVGIMDSIYVIGLGYIICWCLLQLLLQQPMNSIPIWLLLLQILGSMNFSLNSDPSLKQWVEVAALYYLGMAGHFALGNTNTLATIDVAGAFMGLSSHSTILSGILMFIITYASPMLAILSMLVNISLKGTNSIVNSQDVDLQHLLKMTLGYPCLVPLGLNSVLLVAYTIILLLMRNHLFVWSVFSPKFVYVCATTACIYLGVLIVASTVFYTFWAFALRRILQASSCGNDSR